MIAGSPFYSLGTKEVTVAVRILERYRHGPTSLSKSKRWDIGVVDTTGISMYHHLFKNVAHCDWLKQLNHGESLASH